MDHPAKLVTLAFLASLGTFAHAGYAQLADPVGFSGGPNDWKFAPSANDQSYGKVVHQPNGLKAPVPGKVVTMPASYRFASNAGRVASGFVFLNPYVRTAVNIAAWLLSAKLIWDEVNKVWRQTSDQGAGGSAGLWYFPSHPDLGEATSTQVLCQRASAKHFVNVPGYVPFSFFPTGDGMGECAMAAGQSGGYSLRKKEGADECPPGWTQTPAGCLSPALEQPQFEDILSPQPMPSRVPWELPYPSPLPVERPWINPSPGPDPEHRPRFVPTGDPVKNPDYNPSADPSPDNQPWRQPGVRIVPRPTDAEPWRVDYQPTNRPVPGPEPQPDVDEGPGQGNPSDKPIENADLCEKHPDIVACAKMDEVKPEDVNNEDKPLTITPETGWGNENAACPAPVTKQVAGLNLEMSWQPFCDFAKGIRPVVIAMAWLSAALFVLGIARKGD